ncbi:hypothetical protein SVXNc_1025 [Candidatus Nanohalococcus occultus]|uniref:Uncharacterized protein n=2 Tax=Candidatus Nanohalococcus occultus TaxID=2978047 RepID=A0ABY8CFN7_9ARCH|nr:hypothetical protein SVXNc_1025 [Candidatus Nanohaloarchaeota archaeon SVXNc]
MATGLATGTHQNNNDIFSNSDYSATSFSDYSSTTELLSGFVAPFLLLFLIFQRGLEKALMVTLDEDDSNPWNNVKQEKKRLKKYSIVMALAITGMIVPTKFFQNLDTITAAVFGSITFLLYGAILMALLWVFYRVITG